jgi:hypothetical protein
LEAGAEFINRNVGATMRTKSAGNTPKVTTPPTEFPPFNRFVYDIAHGVSADDMTWTISTKLAHLDALLARSYGDSGQAYRMLDDQSQSDYLWACSTLASECRALFEQMSARRAA